MKVLLIGGTGTISIAITRLLAKENDEVYLLNRGRRSTELPDNVTVLQCDINDEAEVKRVTEGMSLTVRVQNMICIWFGRRKICSPCRNM